MDTNEKYNLCAERYEERYRELSELIVTHRIDHVQRREWMGLKEDRVSFEFAWRDVMNGENEMTSATIAKVFAKWLQ